MYKPLRLRPVEAIVDFGLGAAGGSFAREPPALFPIIIIVIIVIIINYKTLAPGLNPTPSPASDGVGPSFERFFIHKMPLRGKTQRIILAIEL